MGQVLGVCALWVCRRCRLKLLYDRSARLRNIKKVRAAARETNPLAGIGPALSPLAFAPPAPAPKPEVVSAPSELPLPDRVTRLARQSVEYVQKLKRSRQLSIPEIYVAAPWVWIEAARENLSVSIDQIDTAVRRAFEEFGTGEQGDLAN